MVWKRACWVLVAALALLLAVPVSADAGDVSLFGEDLVLPAGEELRGNVAIVGGNAEIEPGGTLAGDLAVVGGNARIEGTVQGSVAVIGGTLQLGASSRVFGDVVALGTLDRHPDALVQGSVIAGAEAARRAAEPGGVLRGESGASPLPLRGANGSGLGNTVLGVLRWLATLVGFLVLGVFAVSLFPGPIDHIAGVMTSSAVLSVLMGLVTLVACVILVPLVAITIIGIPLSLALIVALVLAGVAGWAAAGLLLGSRLLKAGSHGRAARAALGVALLVLLSRIPCVGWALTLAAVCWGLGAVVLTRFGTSRDRLWEPFASLGSQAPSGPHAPASSSAGSPGALPLTSDGATPGATPRADETHKLDGLDIDTAE